MLKNAAWYVEWVWICFKLFIFIEKSYVYVNSGAGMIMEYGVVCSYASSGQCPFVTNLHKLNVSSGNKCGEPRHEFWEYNFIKITFTSKFLIVSHLETVA